eukprot:294572-Prymnesium_polylepis.1
MDEHRLHYEHCQPERRLVEWLQSSNEVGRRGDERAGGGRLVEQWQEPHGAQDGGERPLEPAGADDGAHQSAGADDDQHEQRRRPRLEVEGCSECAGGREAAKRADKPAEQIAAEGAHACCGKDGHDAQRKPQDVGAEVKELVDEVDSDAAEPVEVLPQDR